ncbi:ATP-dependent 6-phosphofructokinase [Pseudodesulfovibrio profundus]|uniref:ATP-dependent 6-phosphofructokinase n=1 Tax=Pseudodesulfovibrio profundus TaxID=57320 RepID=A0A2C8F9M8_9BACT|nr:ATP-dependent 6-phosphofructokinase [Pseudodesulfovibrio profundus]MBC18280.1 diphosphate--fructose-6-phosphate 1-phosphotransferase [Desulfovibrio sp.]SOB58852.1 ATP-dependent 6-phosphofructokinase [Pseudodesulfovibrio profundus]
MPKKKQFEIDTGIMNLGAAKIDTPLRNPRFVDDKVPQRLMMTSEELSELADEVVPMQFEKAGPRQKLFFDPSKTKCAVVTCGGICPGVNDVIRALVMEAHHNYGIRSVIGIRNGFRGFIPEYGYDLVDLTLDRVADIHHLGGTILGSSRGIQDATVIVDSLERLNINVLLVIGGDGSMRAAQEIVNEISKRRKKISVIGIPKTIDNDINFITRSFGFDTAVEKATEAIQCAHVEATGVDMGIGLVKLMGREAGFIASQATLAMQEVNFLLVPEDPFTLEGENGLLKALERRLLQRNHALIVCAEGAGQNLMGQPTKRDESGNPKLGDICGLLRKEITRHFSEQNLECNIKFIDPSYIIRSVPANAADRVYCSFLGQQALHAAMSGKTGMVVTHLKSTMVHLPLELVTSKRRTLNVHSDYWCTVMESTGQKSYFTP